MDRFLIKKSAPPTKPTHVGTKRKLPSDSAKVEMPPFKQAFKKAKASPGSTDSVWSKVDDDYLWSHRGDNRNDLIKSLNRPESAIKLRLRQLIDARKTSPAASDPRITTTTIRKDEKISKVGISSVPSTLSEEQAAVLQLISNGESIFFTGAAGTGKSFLLRYIIKACRSRLGDGAVFVTASTGIAAANIQGSTLHSFAGVGLALEPAHILVNRIRSARTSLQRWKACEVLIVDEVSMIDSGLLDKIEAVARGVKDPDSPFGGIQVILCGDFYQLPPVKKGGASTTFAFDAACWPRLVKRCVMLKKVFRQKEQAFIEVLNEVRMGAVSPRVEAMLKSLSKVHLEPPAGIVPTRLYCRNVDVDSMNNHSLVHLGGEEHTFTAEVWGPEQYQKLLEQRVSRRISLKEGAQVMLLINKDTAKGLVNGSRGIVSGFKSVDSEKGGLQVLVPEVKFSSIDADGNDVITTMLVFPEEFPIESGGKKVAHFVQIPLKLAWALTVHKSQGMSISYLEVTLADAFEFGQVYVALSRATSMERLKISSFDARKVTMNPRVKDFYARMAEEELRNPLVPYSVEKVEEVTSEPDLAVAQPTPIKAASSKSSEIIDLVDDSENEDNMLALASSHDDPHDLRDDEYWADMYSNVDAE